MIKSKNQCNSAKAKLERWLKNLEQLHSGVSAGQPDWLIAEQAFGIEEQIKQLTAEIRQFEDAEAGILSLPDPSLVAEIPQLLIMWRISRHLTQRDLADRVGLHENQIQKYESEGYGGASLQTVSRIAAALKEADQFRS